MERYAVIGFYCPTDANPEKDAESERTAVVVDSLEDAEGMLLWYPRGEIVPLRDSCDE